LERIRAEEHPIYFETHTKENERAYSKLGFETVEESELPGTGTRQYAMMWRPQ